MIYFYLKKMTNIYSKIEKRPKNNELKLFDLSEDNIDIVSSFLYACDVFSLRLTSKAFVSVPYIHVHVFGCNDIFPENIDHSRVRSVTVKWPWGGELQNIPDTLVNLTYLNCNNTSVSVIPDTLVNLTKLICRHTSVSVIPDTLVNLIECGHIHQT